MFIQPDRAARLAMRDEVRRLIWHRPVNREVLEHPEMRAVLAVRDIAAVYRILQKHGVSQRRIASLVEQSQSEISEILAGRKVSSYDVLARIADGLGVPRGWMGLAMDTGAELPL